MSQISTKFVGNNQVTSPKMDLSNIGQSIVPDLNGTRNIGSFALRMRDIYATYLDVGYNGNAGNLVLNSGSSSNTGISLRGEPTLMPSGKSSASQILTNTQTIPLGIWTANAPISGNSPSLYLETGISSSGDSGDIEMTTGSAPSGSRGAVVIDGRVFRLPSSSSDPSGGVAGDMYFNTTTNKMKFFNGSIWETITSA